MWNLHRVNIGEKVITSYYVSNLPEGVSKTQIWKSFQKYGRVADVYIGGKKDHSGSTFAFVRFENIRDEKVLEHKISRVRYGHCILRVNIARYQKRQGPRGFKINTSHVVPPEKSYQVVWKATKATRDSRTFAEVTRGTSSRPLASGATPIDIKPATFSVGMEDCVMVGETISI